MAKVNKLQRKSDSRHPKVTRNLLPSTRKAGKHVRSMRKCNKTSEKNEWENSTCSVCMEYPHNAVLLLCSSYNKGCRPYMCATSKRYSNCLEQYKKAYAKLESCEKAEGPELLCPLCRGQVKGWTVVDPARKHLNSKKRSCTHEKCVFSGNYKELRKHVKVQHPSARPREVDPVLEEKWKRLERERERSDVISTIVSSTPGAMVLGDYVIEPNQGVFFTDFVSDLSDDDNDNDIEFLLSYLGDHHDDRHLNLSRQRNFSGGRRGGRGARIAFSRQRWRGRP